MRKINSLALAIVVLALMLFSTTSLAIDNPDAPNLIAEFEIREKPFNNAIGRAENTSRDYAESYANYLKFLDKELNDVYKTLRKKLPQHQQKQLKNSQLAWLKYRDLEFAFIENTWTNKDFGSASSISRGQYKANILRNRIIQLMHYTKNF